MDPWEASQVIFERVQALDPENSSKIMSILLIEENIKKELIRLAFGPEHFLHSFIARARVKLAAKPLSLPSPALGPFSGGRPWAMPSSSSEHVLSGSQQMGGDGGHALYPIEHDCWSPGTDGHRQSFTSSNTEVAIPGVLMLCLYFTRGFCKKGSSCRFMHDYPKHDAVTAEREMAVMQHAKALAAQPSHLKESSFPFSPLSLEGLNIRFQQQSDLQRSTTMLVRSEDMKRIDHDNLVDSPTACQIYLTFPADSTFSEENVSNYFSKYGPVVDVRIPYQQKRMFGFVTFLYPESVKIILSKRGPHFVCDTRVLVKPYKEKGKTPNRIRKLQQPNHGSSSPHNSYFFQVPRFTSRAEATGILKSKKEGSPILLAEGSIITPSSGQED